MKVYISGPMIGLPDNNIPAFNAVEEQLRAAGHEPVNPAKLHEPDVVKSHAEFMRVDIAALCECDAITMLPGWGKSRGATLEYRVAVGIGLVFVTNSGQPRSEAA